VPYSWEWGLLGVVVITLGGVPGGTCTAVCVCVCVCQHVNAVKIPLSSAVRKRGIGAVQQSRTIQVQSVACNTRCFPAMQVPPNYRFAEAPLYLESTVVTGFGRGSRQLGVPTANMDPAALEQQLQLLSQGVYFGWAQLDLPQGSPAADAAVHKMVMNVGRRPTVNPGGHTELCITDGNMVSWLCPYSLTASCVS
jgi:hypothetical protein